MEVLKLVIHELLDLQLVPHKSPETCRKTRGEKTIYRVGSNDCEKNTLTRASEAARASSQRIGARAFLLSALQRVFYI